jgi:hypothetical protein
MIAAVLFRILYIPVSCVNKQRLRIAKLQFHPMFCMGVKLGSLPLRDDSLDQGIFETRVEENILPTRENLTRR